MSSSSYVHSDRNHVGSAFALVAVMLIFAPLVRGGNRPLPLLALEIAALLLFAWLLAKPQPCARISPILLVGLSALVLLPLAQLVPLPAGWVVAARDGFTVALGELGIEGGSTKLSVVPLLTEAAGLALLPPLAVFLVVINLRGSDVQRLMLVFLVMACLQAVLGLVQFGSGGKALAEFGIGSGSGSGDGTYTNRNHLAGLLEMALPVALALLASSVFRLDRSSPMQRRRKSWWHRFKHLGASEGNTNRSMVYGALCLVLLLGLVFTRSRTGIAMGMVGLVMITALLVRNFGGRLSGHLIGVIGSVGLLLATTIGLAPVLARFSVDPMGDARWAIFEASWQAVKDFFPLGSGAGSYVEVINAYHPDKFGGEAYINHAHNDYLEWLVEGGVVALVVMLLFAAAYVARWPAVWRVRDWQTLHMMQVGAGVGLFVLMLHGFTDYNLRIPANQIYFALLAAVFFHSGADKARRPARWTEDAGAGGGGADAGAAGGVGSLDDVDDAGVRLRMDAVPAVSATQRVRRTRGSGQGPEPTSASAPKHDAAATAAWASAPAGDVKEANVGDAVRAAQPLNKKPSDESSDDARRQNPFAD